jgi:hypothetical protein
MQVNRLGSTRHFWRGFTDAIRHVECDAPACIAQAVTHWQGDDVFYVY